MTGINDPRYTLDFNKMMQNNTVQTAPVHLSHAAQSAMHPRDFAYWLQGFFEIGDVTTLNANQVQTIKDHLALVFNKATPDRSKPQGATISMVHPDPNTPEIHHTGEPNLRDQANSIPFNTDVPFIINLDNGNTWNEQWGVQASC